MKNQEKNVTKETNNDNMDSITRAETPRKPEKRKLKRNCKGKINYAESDTESDFEAEIRVPDGNLEFKNYSTNPTINDPVHDQIDLRDFNNDKENSEIDSSSTDIELDETATLGQGIIAPDTFNQEEFEENVTNKDNYQSGNKLTPRIERTYNIVKTKELLQFRRDNIVYLVACDGSPCDEDSRALIDANKIPIKQKLQVGNINEIKRHNNKYLLGLCIRGENAESQEIIRANLRDTLT